jgi:hypothetical protein
VQLKSGLESYRAGGPRPIDEKKLDFEAAFFEARTTGKNWIGLRVGRQELNYGSGRLISVREGPNVRQSFDGLKVMSSIGSWNVDAFAARPDLDKPGFFDNSPDHRTAFWGIYASRPRTGRLSTGTASLRTTELRSPIATAVRAMIKEVFTLCSP